MVANNNRIFNNARTSPTPPGEAWAGFALYYIFNYFFLNIQFFGPRPIIEYLIKCEPAEASPGDFGRSALECRLAEVYQISPISLTSHPRRWDLSEIGEISPKSHPRRWDLGEIAEMVWNPSLRDFTSFPRISHHFTIFHFFLNCWIFS